MGVCSLTSCAHQEPLLTSRSRWRCPVRTAYAGHLLPSQTLRHIAMGGLSRLMGENEIDDRDAFSINIHIIIIDYIAI